jgi:hypothetical protein
MNHRAPLLFAIRPGIVGLEDVKRNLASQGAYPVAMTPEEFGAFMKDETAKWAKIVRASGVRADCSIGPLFFPFPYQNASQHPAAKVRARHEGRRYGELVPFDLEIPYLVRSPTIGMPRGVHSRGPLVAVDVILAGVGNHRAEKGSAFLIVRGTLSPLAFQERHHPTLGREDEVAERVLAIFGPLLTCVLKLLNPCNKLPVAQELCAIIGDDRLNREKTAHQRNQPRQHGPPFCLQGDLMCEMPHRRASVVLNALSDGMLPL